MINSLYRMLSVSSWPEWAYEGDDQNEVQRFISTAKNHVTARRIQRFNLDDGDVRVITMAGMQSKWKALFATVTGAASITVDGVDLDGITPIEGTMSAQGTWNFPGLLILNSYDAVPGYTLVGLQNNTSVTLWALTTVSSTDPILNQ